MAETKLEKNVTKTVSLPVERPPEKDDFTEKKGKSSTNESNIKKPDIDFNLLSYRVTNDAGGRQKIGKGALDEHQSGSNRQKKQGTNSQAPKGIITAITKTNTPLIRLPGLRKNVLQLKRKKVSRDGWHR